MTEKVMTLHPDSKAGVNIDKSKYDAVSRAILDVIGSRGEMAFAELSDAVGQQLTDFDGSIGWYTTTVKLDLEARGQIERVPGITPQRLRLK
ncbi:MAG: hypothetical protein CL610_19405 [Anaerolineaceae bacterium]|nr:hypothetical protein [Anaerolineaceae bacterium]